MRLSLNIFLSSVLVALLLPLSSGAVTLDGYAAVVGEQVITVGEVKENMQRNNRGLFMAMQVGEKVSDKKLAEVYDESLEQLIGDDLIIEEYKSLKEDGKVDIPEDAVDSTIQKIIRNRYSNSRSAFFNDLKSSGMTFEEFKQQQRRNIIIMVMRNNHFSDPVKIAPGEVRLLYESRMDQYRKPAQVEIALISVSREKDPDSEINPAKKVQRMLGEIKAGSKFADVARSGSDGSKAEEGGYRGWVPIGNLRKELRTSLKNMEPGAVSGIIGSENSYYIIKLMDRKPATIIEFDQVEGDLKKELLQAANQKRMRAWVEDLKKKYYVKRYPLQEIM